MSNTARRQLLDALNAHAVNVRDEAYAAAARYATAHDSSSNGAKADAEAAYNAAVMSDAAEAYAKAYATEWESQM